jgi:hypothetical protein
MLLLTSIQIMKLLIMLFFFSIVGLVEDQAMLHLQCSNRSSEMLALRRVAMLSLKAKYGGVPNQLFLGPEREPP